MSANYYTYHIYVPDSQLVRVTKFARDNQRLTEAAGKFRSDRSIDKIRTYAKIARNLDLSNRQDAKSAKNS
ncbi:hypothetical protein WA1_11335 [Scytonema hofmannii PCC 7110]|uniref:Uncharacterized protein n=1 Tax=Scytonema hofmannii PCC 7110 TaxID=128403 RepID=A0A139XFI1_9CYAN|nr:hypothetical protein [Scytonema hofmannii]KYC43423.1 hypothetical protein WA1_11335 [Scytonema hofmannii PCC 7110]